MADTPTIGTVKLTAKGLRLLAKVQAGAVSQFTRAVIGDGFMPDDQDVAGLTDLISEIPSHQTGEEATSATVDITRITYGEGTVTLRIKIKNGDTAFYLREIGIKAQDPDEGEVIYAYINFGDGASAMPAFDGSTYVTRNIDLTFIISNAANVTANVTLPAEVSYEEFEAHKNALELDHPDKCVRSRHLSDGCIQITHISDEAKTELLSETQSALQKIQYGVRTWQDVRDFKIDYRDTYDDNQEYRTVAIKGVTAINMLGFGVDTNYSSLSNSYIDAGERSGFCSTIDDTGMEITTEFFVNLDFAPKESDKVKHTEI